MASRASGRQGDTKDDITSIGTRSILDFSYRSFEARRLSRGPTTTGNDSEDLAFLTLEVVLYGLTTSAELMAAISDDGQISPESMHAIIIGAITVFEGGAEIADGRPFSMQQAEMALDGAFRVENQKTPRADHAIGFLKLAIASVATAAWYRPRVEVGPPVSGKRRRRYLSTVHLGAILESMGRTSEGGGGNEGDLIPAADETDSHAIRIDLRSTRVSDLEWAVFEAYAIDDDATLQLLAAREWPGVKRLSVKQIRGILKRTGQKLVKALGPGYSDTN